MPDAVARKTSLTRDQEAALNARDAAVIAAVTKTSKPAKAKKSHPAIKAVTVTSTETTEVKPEVKTIDKGISSCALPATFKARGGHTTIVFSRTATRVHHIPMRDAGLEIERTPLDTFDAEWAPMNTDPVAAAKKYLASKLGRSPEATRALQGVAGLPADAVPAPAAKSAPSPVRFDQRAKLPAAPAKAPAAKPAPTTKPEKAKPAPAAKPTPAATGGSKIKVLKAVAVREGTWTHFMLTAMSESKTTDEVLAKVAASQYAHKKPDFKWAVAQGYIALA